MMTREVRELSVSFDKSDPTIQGRGSLQLLESDNTELVQTERIVWHQLYACVEEELGEIEIPLVHVLHANEEFWQMPVLKLSRGCTVRDDGLV